ncbi:MAG: cold shock domain-containing protein [Gammaproteobacteria bacterium]|jgi:cold shock CspA family protein|nr:MAG: cold shock domain-containing protein [Gammaproteobacteria bacterium]
MRTFFIFTASAVLLAAIIVELSTRLWPGNNIALLVIAAIALLAQAYLSLRFGAPPAAPAQTGRERSQTRTDQGAKQGKQRRERGEGSRDKSGDGKKAAEKSPESKAAPSGDRETGTVKWFNRTKGFGFIVRESGEEIFVHQRSILSEGSGDNRRRPSLKDGQSVTFVVANREKGLQAEEVSPA